MPDDVGVRYRINARDEISFVDEDWHRVAVGGQLREENVIGRQLWDYITDDSTRRLYEEIIARVRRGHRAQFTLRCDAPAARRLLEMTIRAHAEDEIEFETRTLQVEPRPPVPLLEPDRKRAEEWVRSCAWCSRIHVGAGQWAEVEAAAEHLRLFERDALPRLTHGICEECHDRLTATLLPASDE